MEPHASHMLTMCCSSPCQSLYTTRLQKQACMHNTPECSCQGPFLQHCMQLNSFQRSISTSAYIPIAAAELQQTYLCSDLSIRGMFHAIDFLQFIRDAFYPNLLLQYFAYMLSLLILNHTGKGGLGLHPRLLLLTNLKLLQATRYGRQLSVNDQASRCQAIVPG